MRIEQAEIPDVKIIIPDRFVDPRGFFSETYSQAKLRNLGVDLTFVQENHSLSAKAGVVRGLHFQLPPFAQDKLLRVTRGAIFDVAVDIRPNSPTFGHCIAEKISAADWRQLLIPVGFAHGFCTLEPDTEVLYKVTSVYSPQHERGILWNDPELKIPWPIAAKDAVLSEKDGKNPTWRESAHFLADISW